MTLEPGSFIWATRGRRWGFRFLRDGGFADPLPIYEAAFAGAADQREVAERVGDAIVLRFPDPEGRQDHARRVISHDFVIRTADTSDLPALDEAARLAWSAVSDEYDHLWDAAP